MEINKFVPYKVSHVPITDMLFVIEKKNHYCIPVCHIFMFECVLHTVKTNHLRLLVFLNTGVQSSIYRSDSRASSREQALKKVRSLVYF